MLMTINKQLTGIPVDMVPALAGQGSPYAVIAPVAANDTPRFGAAIACFISGFKSTGRKS